MLMERLYSEQVSISYAASRSTADVRIYVVQRMLKSVQIKISDLGSAVTFSDDRMGFVGSNNYRAPEITMGKMS